jgi:hypothetical protein
LMLKNFTFKNDLTHFTIIVFLLYIIFIDERIGIFALLVRPETLRSRLKLTGFFKYLLSNLQKSQVSTNVFVQYVDIANNN